MVTRPNWMAPFHIARAMAWLLRLRSGRPAIPGTSAHGTGTATVARAGKPSAIGCRERGAEPAPALGSLAGVAPAAPASLPGRGRP